MGSEEGVVGWGGGRSGEKVGRGRVGLGGAVGGTDSISVRWLVMVERSGVGGWEYSCISAPAPAPRLSPLQVMSHNLRAHGSSSGGSGGRVRAARAVWGRVRDLRREECERSGGGRVGGFEVWCGLRSAGGG